MAAKMLQCRCADRMGVIVPERNGYLLPGGEPFSAMQKQNTIAMIMKWPLHHGDAGCRYQIAWRPSKLHDDALDIIFTRWLPMIILYWMSFCGRFR